MDDKITSAIPIDQYTYIVGTSKGLSATRYKYTVENDIKKYTSDDAKMLFNKNI